MKTISCYQEFFSCSSIAKTIKSTNFTDNTVVQKITLGYFLWKKILLHSPKKLLTLFFVLSLYAKLKRKMDRIMSYFTIFSLLATNYHTLRKWKNSRFEHHREYIDHRRVDEKSSSFKGIFEKCRRPSGRFFRRRRVVTSSSSLYSRARSENGSGETEVCGELGKMKGGRFQGAAAYSSCEESKTP